VEAYAVDELVASAEALGAGLGLLVGELVGLVGELTGPGAVAGSFDQVEVRVAERGRELLRMVLQHVLDGPAAGERRLAGVADAQGVGRPWAERGHARTVVSGVGPVTVRRLAYRGAGAPNLYPRDLALNLPARRYSWQVQQQVVRYALAGSYEQAGQWLRAGTGVSVGKQQLEQIVLEAAADAQAFYARAAPAAGPPGLPLVLSADGKGVAMRPEARRRRSAAVPRTKTFGKRLGTGEKTGHKRMAETGVVFDALPAGQPRRTPEQVMTRPAGSPSGSPRAVNRWYTVDITASRAATISAVFDEAERRDPRHQRTWLALADGDQHQINAIRAQAARRGITITILVDFIHVLEYLWKVAWCFHPARGPAAETWVTTQALAILHGHAPAVIDLIRQLAASHPPRPGGEHERLIAVTLTYLTNKQPYLDYPRALENGWPIATGVIEGACRHLINDRMGITGARWGLPGAEAILRLRAIRANGDLDTYWAHHIEQERQRNHLSRYQPAHTPAA